MTGKVLIVSPHPDDACFSLGGFILKNHEADITVWDVFSEQEYSVAGSNETDAKEQIKREEEAAMQALDVSLVMDDMPEAGLRGYARLSDILNFSFADFKEKQLGEKVYDRFDYLAEKINPDIIFIPLGCGAHVDHLITREVVLDWWHRQRKNVRLFLYEELPYGLNKAWMNQALESYPCKLKESFIEIDDFTHRKAEIMSLYKSQIKDREIRAVITHSGSIIQGHNIERIWEAVI